MLFKTMMFTAVLLSAALADAAEPVDPPPAARTAVAPACPAR
ncbi:MULTISPECIES: hypothetical protein [Saccharopolyspora]|uniref:Uncharacterized protein n=1 Tax=Saccharopolyspora cebuensis TaxID=418759 RepID=A0ABV4CFJ3_9PSEU